MIKSRIPERYQKVYWTLRFVIILAITLSGSYYGLIVLTELGVSDRIRSMSIVASSVLTVALIIVYRDIVSIQSEQVEELTERRKIQDNMSNIQESQSDIQESQTEILEKQTQIQTRQNDLIRGQNRPHLEISIEDVDDDSFIVSVENLGSGIAKSVSLETRCYVFLDEVRELYDLDDVSWSSEAIHEEIHSETEAIRLKDLDLPDFDRSGMANALRPEKDTYEVIGPISPDESPVKGYLTSQINFHLNGEYDEQRTSEYIPTVRSLGFSVLMVEYVIRYTSLSDTTYYEFLTNTNVKLEGKSNLESIMSSDFSAHIITEETVNPKYYEE